MIAALKDLIVRDRHAQSILGIFLVLICWWIGLQYFVSEEVSEFRNLIWAASYQIVALLGGIWGIAVARSWGGTRSTMGRAGLAFTLGLLLQVFGQSTFSFYNLVLKVDIPYPSLADIGYFGSIPFYIYGAVMLAHAAGVGVSLRSYKSKAQALLIPLVMLIFSYSSFLQGYEFADTSHLQIFLDFAYPLGQALYVSIAILAYLFSRNMLGGIMKGRIIFILWALVIQYLADYNFLYQAINETWYNGGYGDLLYLLAYLFMALGLLQLKTKYIRPQI